MSSVGKGTRWVAKVGEWLTGLGFEVVRTRWMDPGEDITATRGGLGLSIEGKDHSRLTLAAAIDQAERNATDNHIPVVVAHRTGHASVDSGYVVMSGHSFARLLEYLR